MRILQYALEAVPAELTEAINSLQQATWPEAIWEPENDEIPAYLEKRPGTRAFIAMDDRLLGYAEIFPRTMYTDNGGLEVWGLASVCVAKASQGLGIGRKIVEACFAQVDAARGVCLFQTTLPGFYQKLNCRLVNNKFVNRTDTKSPNENPFWDEYIMIYPSGFHWPSGTIDLNGRGY